MLLDGAHNPAGAAALAAALDDLRPLLAPEARRRCWSGVMADKDVARMSWRLAAAPALREARSDAG